MTDAATIGGMLVFIAPEPLGENGETGGMAWRREGAKTLEAQRPLAASLA